MRNFIEGFSNLLRAARIVLITLVVAFSLMFAYEWKVQTDSRISMLQSRMQEVENSTVAYKWLAEGVVTLPDGRKLSRAQLLDLLLAKSIKADAEDSDKAAAR